LSKKSLVIGEHRQQPVSCPEEQDTDRNLAAGHDSGDFLRVEIFNVTETNGPEFIVGKNVFCNIPEIGPLFRGNGDALSVLDGVGKVALKNCGRFSLVFADFINDEAKSNAIEPRRQFFAGPELVNHLERTNQRLLGEFLGLMETSGVSRKKMAQSGPIPVINLVKGFPFSTLNHQDELRVFGRGQGKTMRQIIACHNDSILPTSKRFGNRNFSKVKRSQQEYHIFLILFISLLPIFPPDLAKMGKN